MKENLTPDERKKIERKYENCLQLKNVLADMLEETQLKMNNSRDVLLELCQLKIIDYETFEKSKEYISHLNDENSKNFQLVKKALEYNYYCIHEDEDFGFTEKNFELTEEEKNTVNELGNRLISYMPY